MNERIPGLDGLRALAIFMVIALHTAQRFRWPDSGTFAHRLLVGHGGGMWTGDGVGIFFTLSGFLITTLLLREYRKSGTIHLREFYLRRTFRILPPLLAYLFVALVFCLVENVSFHWQDFTSAFLFYRDYYFVSKLWITEHTWSLSVEEQFYLLWPLGLIFLLRWRNRSTAAVATACLTLATPLLRLSGKLFHIDYFNHHEELMFHCRMDSLMSGCCVALCVGLPKFEQFYQRLAKTWWVLPLEFYPLSLILGNLIGINYRKTVGLTVDSIAIALFIVWVTRNPGHAVGRILNSKVMATAGVLSYSAYLWQTFFLHRENGTFLSTMPLCFFLIWATAWLSYVLVEQPFLRLRQTIQERWRASTPHEARTNAA